MADMFSLHGRKVLITGGGQGLGLTMAKGLAASGASIAIVDIDGDRARQAASSIASGQTRAVGITGDVTSPADAERAVDEAVRALGGLDILLNNAGIAILAPAEEVSFEDFKKTYEVDVFGLFTMSQKAFPALRDSGHGVIVNMASMAGISVLTPQEHTAYHSAKAAVIMITKSLAVEWAEFGLRVNAIAPGYMLTPPVEKLRDEDPGRWSEWMSRVPLRRVGVPDDLVGAVVYLTSDASSYMTGATVVVDGGYTCL
jgi:NAD(P)-dependent dehydrogenase (short-subunit alcohol dehydrogenase family)